MKSKLSSIIQKFPHLSPPGIVDLVVVLSIFLFSFYLMYHTFRYQDGQLVLASKVWSDFGAHLPLIRSFSMGNNFPPEYPTFPGEPIRYHYLFYLLVGLIEKSGFNIAFSLNFWSIVGFFLLLSLIYFLTKLIFKSPLAGVIALLLFLFNGSLTYVEYFKIHPPSVDAFTNIIKTEKFTSFGPWDGKSISAFWNLNIYTNQRHIALGFAILLLIVYQAVTIFQTHRRLERSQLIMVISLMLALPILHQAAFIGTLVIIGMLALLHPQNKNLRYLSAAVITGAIPGIIHTYLNQTSHLVFQPGFLSHDLSPRGLFTYWVDNLGVYIPVLPFIFLLVNRTQKKLLLSVFPLFILANLFRFTPDMINNHKFVNIWMIFITSLTAGVLAKLTKLSWGGKLISFLLFLSLTFSGIIDFFPIINDHYFTIPDYQHSDIGNWIALHIHPRSVFLTTSYLYNPASLTGRRTFVDYGYFNWSLGYNETARRQALPQILSPNADLATICSTISQFDLDYLLIAPGNGDIPNIDPHLSTIAKTTIPTYTSTEEYQVFTVQSLCPSV